jgi:hypothetical protein
MFNQASTLVMLGNITFTSPLQLVEKNWENLVSKNRRVPRFAAAFVESSSKVKAQAGIIAAKINAPMTIKMWLGTLIAVLSWQRYYHICAYPPFCASAHTGVFKARMKLICEFQAQVLLEHFNRFYGAETRKYCSALVGARLVNVTFPSASEIFVNSGVHTTGGIRFEAVSK